MLYKASFFIKSPFKCMGSWGTHSRERGVFFTWDSLGIWNKSNKEINSTFYGKKNSKLQKHSKSTTMFLRFGTLDLTFSANHSLMLNENHLCMILLMNLKTWYGNTKTGVVWILGKVISGLLIKKFSIIYCSTIFKLLNHILI